MCVYCDASWVDNIDDHQFISSYVFLLGNGAIGCSNMIESLKVKLCKKKMSLLINYQVITIMNYLILECIQMINY